MDSKYKLNKTWGWFYIAGFFDGEGSISLTKRIDSIDGVRVQVSMDNTDINVIKAISEYLKEYGIGNFYAYKISKENLKKHPNWNQVYSVKITNHKQVIKFCKRIRDKLIVKKEIVDTILKECLSRKWNKHKGFTINTHSQSDEIRSQRGWTAIETRKAKNQLGKPQ